MIYTKRRIYSGRKSNQEMQSAKCKVKEWIEGVGKMKQMKLHTLLILLMFSLTVFVGGKVTFAESIDPYNDDSQYTYGENIGWLNAEPLGDGGPGVAVEDTKLTGYIWAENIGWVSFSCENTGSCGTVNYGVTTDGSRNLAGFAWGENIDWISFSCENTGSCGTVDYGVTIDPVTGEFNGYAWGENIDWITFRSTAPVSFGVTTSWPETMTVPIELQAGWHMISLPVNPTDKRPKILFPEAIVVYGYEKGTGYARVKPDEDLEIGKGYWILLNEARTYTITDNPIDEYNLSVQDGWYMIGGCTSDAKPSGNNCNIRVIYGYEPGAGYKRVQVNENLIPGKGYWILIEGVTDQAFLTVQGIM
jgi:hypothetical protein